MIRGKPWAACLVALASVAVSPAADRAELQILIPEAPRPARESLEATAGILERLAGLPAGTVHVTASGDLDAARRALALRPALALVSTPLYLEALASGDRPRLLRSPARGGKPSEAFHVVVRRGGPVAKLADLAGKRLAGNRLWDARYVRLLLGAGAPEVEREPVRQTLQAIKGVREGTVDAALLSDLELAALQGLVPEGELASIHVSAELPLAPLLSYLPEGNAREDAIVRALPKLCQDAEGALLCEAFGIETFVPADRAACERAAAAYAAIP